MSSLIGSGPGQISVNGMLGEMAFQNTSGITVRSIQSPVGVTSTTTINNFPTSGTINPFTNLTLQPNGGNVFVGTGASLATTATEGFLCIPTCSGPPTGITSAIPPGEAPLVFDTLNNRLYIRTPSGWRYSITTT